MNIMQALLSGNNASALNNAATRLGLGEDQIRALVQNVVPVLAKGVQRNSPVVTVLPRWCGRSRAEATIAT